MMSDHMEIGDTGLVPTKEGFENVNTGEKLDHDGNPREDKDEDN